MSAEPHGGTAGLGVAGAQLGEVALWTGALPEPGTHGAVRPYSSAHKESSLQPKCLKLEGKVPAERRAGLGRPWRLSAWCEGAPAPALTAGGGVLSLGRESRGNRIWGRAEFGCECPPLTGALQGLAVEVRCGAVSGGGRRGRSLEGLP